VIPAAARSVRAVGTLDGAVQLYMVATAQQIGEPLPVSDSPGVPVTSVAFDSHARFLAAGSNDGSVRKWNVSYLALRGGRIGPDPWPPRTSVADQTPELAVERGGSRTIWKPACRRIEGISRTASRSLSRALPLRSAQGTRSGCCRAARSGPGT
jgi:WD40 repeat protein